MLKDRTDVASGFSNSFITVTEKLGIKLTHKPDAISILKYEIPGNVHRINIIPNTEAQINVQYIPYSQK
jgi:protein subunit release factor A